MRVILTRLQENKELIQLRHIPKTTTSDVLLNKTDATRLANMLYEFVANSTLLEVSCDLTEFTSDFKEIKNDNN